MSRAERTRLDAKASLHETGLMFDGKGRHSAHGVARAVDNAHNIAGFAKCGIGEGKSGICFAGERLPIVRPINRKPLIGRAWDSFGF